MLDMCYLLRRLSFSSGSGRLVICASAWGPSAYPRLDPARAAVAVSTAAAAHVREMSLASPTVLANAIRELTLRTARSIGLLGAWRTVPQEWRRGWSDHSRLWRDRARRRFGSVQRRLDHFLLLDPLRGDSDGSGCG